MRAQYIDVSGPMRLLPCASYRSHSPWSAYTLEQTETKVAKSSSGSGTLGAGVSGVSGGGSDGGGGNLGLLAPCWDSKFNRIGANE